ncbi:MAG: HTH domain-containing protein [Bacteroidota bacterium]
MPRKFFRRFERIDQLIRLKATGKPSELAERLEISESTLYEFIGLMKELGAPIQWDKKRNSYIYDPEGK